MKDEEVLIIGAGATGLACAAALTRAKIPVQILESGDDIAGKWRQRPDGLTLIAGKRASAMPGTRFPPSVRKFPTRNELVTHLGEFARKHHLQVQTGVEAQQITRDGGHWRVTTSQGLMRAKHVVVATGLFAEPVIPDWPGGERYTGRLLHAAEYREPTSFIGKRVLIVGVGTTGVEIAQELASAGETKVQISVRSQPNLVPRALGVLPGLKLMLKLPPKVGDAQMRAMRRFMIGDLSAYGLIPPRDGPFSIMRKRHNSPTNIGRECVQAIRDGRIKIVPALETLVENGAILADGSHVRVDAIIAATGYRSSLKSLVGHLRILDSREEPKPYDAEGPHAGLHFAGFENVPGQLAFCHEAAKRILGEISPAMVNSK